jgi:hypothetical protein
VRQVGYLQRKMGRLRTTTINNMQPHLIPFQSTFSITFPFISYAITPYSYHVFLVIICSNVTHTQYFWQFKFGDCSNTNFTGFERYVYVTQLFQMFLVLFTCLLDWNVCLKQILHQEYKVHIFTSSQSIELFHCPPSEILEGPFI